jgi:outer membrane protein OmpA-like peptidoglycan-associated protein
MYYRSDQDAIPDEIEIALYDEKTQKLVKRKIPIVELGRKLIIENLLYETNDASLPNNVPELDIMAKFMRDKQNIAIVVEGHTDSVGPDAVNDYLSKKRAESVKQYIVDRGVAENRIKTIGQGERRPIASNLTQFGRKLNRRTEIIIISK